MAEEKSQWVSIGQAASYLGVSRDTLRRWDKNGKLKALRSPTNRRYYIKKQLDSIMSGKKEEKATKKPGKKVTLGKKPKLILVGVLSFIIAVILALLLQFLLF